VPVNAANLFWRDGKLDEAIKYYRRALSRDYGAVDARLNLARLLMQTGRSDEALREVEICQRLRPGWTEAEQLAEEVRRRSSATRPSARN
jgi:tetratricopeptide (TPR) repeat protein